jgi:glycerophosphoryl diester phosphodiesterase
MYKNNGKEHFFQKKPDRGRIRQEDPMKRHTIRILLVEIINHNFGDGAIADCTEYLIRKAMRSLKRTDYTILHYNLASGEKYPVRFADCIIFDGGGILKYDYENFHTRITSVLKIAEKYEIPVMFNAVGLGRIKEDDPDWQALRDAMNFSCIKMITCRDDCDKLNSKYLQGELKGIPVFDTAIWAPKVYGLKPARRKGKPIGLGIARDMLFVDNGIPEIDRDFLLSFWCGLAKELEDRGYEWVIYTNGLYDDEAFADDVLAAIGHGRKADRPLSGRELAETVRECSGIIACRMHSNILAWALKVPSVGFVWNEKVEQWGARIHHPERFLDPGSMTPKAAADALVRAMKGTTRGPSYFDRARVEKHLRSFIEEYAAVRTKYHTLKTFRKDVRKKYGSDITFDDSELPEGFGTRMAAAALGGTMRQYKSINSVDILDETVSGGFSMVETDIRLTADGRLVLVKNWDDMRARMLGLSDEVPRYDDFMSAKYLSHWKTSSFEDLLRYMENHAGFFDPEKGPSVILDPGKTVSAAVQRAEMKSIEIEAVLDELQRLIAGSKVSEKSFMIFLCSNEELDALRKRGLGIEPIMRVPVGYEGESEEDRAARLDAFFDACEAGNVSKAAVTIDQLSEPLAERCRERGLKLYVQPLMNRDKMINAILLGADRVLSSMSSPEEMNSWFGF